jgi:hypothetical protein
MADIGASVRLCLYYGALAAFSSKKKDIQGGQQERSRHFLAQSLTAQADACASVRATPTAFSSKKKDIQGGQQGL